MTDVSICLWGWTPSLSHAQSVTLLTYSHTPPLCLPSGSWHSGVISNSQLLQWLTTDWTSSCWGLQQQPLLLYHLRQRASGSWGEDETYGFWCVWVFPYTFWLWLILQTYLSSLSLACLNIETETKRLQTFSFRPFFLNKHWKMSHTGTHLHLHTERQTAPCREAFRYR